MPYITFPLILALLLCSYTVNAEIYKWKDENGKTHYSGTPRVLAPNVKEVKLQKQPADRANAHRQERLLNNKKRDIRRIKEEKRSKLRKEKRVQAEQKAMLKQEARDRDMCEKYKARYSRYQKKGIQGINVVTGKKQKLTGTAARNALKDAKENVELFCK